jgi:hypothetical protein
MFEPEHLDSDCPKCFQRKVYLDREIGYYCMSCGHEFSADEVTILLEKISRAPLPMHTPSVQSKKQPVTVIKELSTRKKKKPDHARHDKATS